VVERSVANVISHAGPAFEASPRVSVVLATCNRHGPVARAVRSILAVRGHFELLIVDQSDEDRAKSPLDEALAGRHARVHRMRREGLAAARNTGIRLCRGEYILMTDDDCEVPENWLEPVVRIFERHARIALIFGNVIPGPCNALRGFIPGYLRSAAFLGRSVAQKNHVEGMGACMALRRDLWVALGGFDETLGAGRRFVAAEESDFALRALRRGYYVYETPDFAVTHHGFRTWEEGRGLAGGYWHGTGAMFGKHLQLAPASTLWLLARLALRWLVGGASLTARSMGRVATRRARLTCFSRGLLAGLRCKVDHRRECFES
jgi:GT2 family glycosyltransferase